MIQKTAILVFTRTASEEAAAKHWLSSTQQKKNFAIAHHLIAQTIERARATQLPVFVIESPQQQGNGFGQKFCNAIAGVFDQGFSQVISIGTDCPGITTSLLLKAHQQLQEKAMVVGPDKKGGVYLLGLHKSHFDAAHFQQFSWQTSHLREELLDFAAVRKVGALLLKSLHDFHHNLQHTSTRQLLFILGRDCLTDLLQILAIKYQLVGLTITRVKAKEIPSTSLTSPPLWLRYTA